MSEKITTICGAEKDLTTWIYKKENGMYVRRADIESKKGGDDVRILFFADVHFNWTNEKDIWNDEIIDTAFHRHWNAGAASVRAITKAMDYGDSFDKVVIGGDVLDFMSYGAMELMDKYIWDRNPEVTVAIGGHDWTREMETGKPDQTSVEERLKTLADYWRHDIYYVSEVLADKVMLITLDNSDHCYRESQIEKLKADIEKAKKENLVVLIFQHESITTGKPEDSEVMALIECDGDRHDFYNDAVGMGRKADKATLEVIKLITENADVVKGLFCGHHHSGFYTEVKASYTDENGKHDAVIPQYVMEGLVYNGYAGHVMEITVK